MSKGVKVLVAHKSTGVHFKRDSLRGQNFSSRIVGPKAKGR
jgi:hypothetical protein